MQISVQEIFEEGRTCTNFASKPVSSSLLEELYNLMKMGPTSANCSPLRMMFVQSSDAKKKLLNCVMPGNAEAVTSAPVTVLFAYDAKFTDKMSILFPHNPGMAEYFKDPKAGFDTATRNSTLQAAYFMMIARSKGLACGPMSGFDATKLEAEFFRGTEWKANFICNIGYAEGASKFPRLPRLDFNDACRIV
jgi:3-hydroxypropanoate dehydrogenase